MTILNADIAPGQKKDRPVTNGVGNSIASSAEDILDTIGMGIWEWRPGEEVLHWTPIVSKLHSVPGDKLKGSFEALFANVDPGDKMALVEAMDEAVAGGGDYSLVYQVAGSEGKSRFIEATGRVLSREDTDNAVLIGICSEVTSKVTEQKKWEQFISLVGHELKNPLASIKAFVQLIKRRLNKGKTKDIETYVDRIDQQTDKVIRLVSDLVDVTRVRAGKFVLNFREFDYDSLLEQVIADMSATAGERRIKKNGKSGIKVYGDEDRISQVLVNLISNAIHYSDDGATIELVTDVEDGHLITKVKDSGIGIPEQFHGDLFIIFNRFAEESRNPGGIGMGLYLSRAIAMEHGGDLYLEKSNEKGSVFAFKIPLEGNRQ